MKNNSDIFVFHPWEVGTMGEHPCSECRFLEPINGISYCPSCSDPARVVEDPETESCESWQDEDGNTILGEDW